METTNLEELYNQISEAIAKIDFSKIWEGFEPLKFAVYNDDKCFFNGAFIEKTVDFCANTAIEYQGDIIAIWYVREELEIPVFASKIVHEMFHAFQEKRGWDCFANEKEAPFKYVYSEENLCLKLRENKLLLEILDNFDKEKYKEVLLSRKYRSEKYPYEFSYECAIEEIEGSANYVEWQVLKQLDEQKALEYVANTREYVTTPEDFFPIRITGYFTGPLMINAMKNAGDFFYGAKDRPVISHILAGIEPVAKIDMGDKNDIQIVKDALSSYSDETKRIVETAVANNEIVLKGPVELVSVNIGDTRYYNGYLTSRFFVMYRENGEKKVIRDNYVVKMLDETTVDAIYKWV